jgi:circadian clock protein KaiB
MTATSAPPAGDPVVPEVWQLRLYVAGTSPRSLRAFANLRQLCEEHLTGRYEIEIVDLEKRPQRAREDDIVAIPTLIRTQPLPSKRIVGDLSDTSRVLFDLQLGVVQVGGLQ